MHDGLLLMRDTIRQHVTEKLAELFNTVTHDLQFHLLTLAPCCASVM